jgi:hypothetical protein
MQMTKYLLRTSTSLALVAALVLVSMASKCDSGNGGGGGNGGGVTSVLKKYSPYVKTGVRVLGKAKTIFAANGLSTANFDTAVKIGGDAVAALEADATNAIELTANFIDAFENIATDAGLIKDPTKRTIVLVTMAVGSEALHALADQMKLDVSTQPNATRKAAADAAAESNGGQRIAAFAAKTRWRCRNSSNGQVEQMSFCEAHPETSTVERY